METGAYDAQRVFKSGRFLQTQPMKCTSLIFAGCLLTASFSNAALTYLPTYEENKKAFVDQVGPHLFQSWPVKNNADLTTDLALYNYGSDQLLVLSSGLHGIEGYLGSSLQRELIHQIKDRKKLKTDVLFLHALNPWGMKNKRRVNENNIDLNRNFQTLADLYQKKNEDYVNINSYLNPEEAIGLGFFHKFGFVLNSVRLIVSYSLETLRKSILIGQYSQKKGLYFGGAEADDLQYRIDILFEKDLSHYKKVLWIDLHTGYGEKAKLHLLANDSKSESGKKVQTLFPQQSIDFGDQKNFYKTDGDMISYILAKSNPKLEISGITFEFGTMDSQKILGSIESLRRMVIENQGFHHGYESESDRTEVAQLFEEMFFPQDEEWKKKALQQTKNLLDSMLEETP